MLYLVRGMLYLVRGMLYLVRGMLYLVRGMLYLVRGMLYFVLDSAVDFGRHEALLGEPIREPPTYRELIREDRLGGTSSSLFGELFGDTSLFGDTLLFGDTSLFGDTLLSKSISVGD